MSAETVEMLRKKLREKFPQAHGLRAEHGVAGAGGLVRGDDAPPGVGSFPVGAVSEVVPGGAGSGISLLVAALVGEADEVAEHPDLVLVDGADGFDPGSFSGAACSKLLWVRCRSAMEMLKAADLLVRDGNVPMVLLDATGLDRRELTGLPKSGWWRLKQAAEGNGCRLVVMSPFPVVPCASYRLTLSARLGLEDFDRDRGELLKRLEAGDQRRRAGGN